MKDDGNELARVYMDQAAVHGTLNVDSLVVRAGGSVELSGNGARLCTNALDLRQESTMKILDGARIGDCSGLDGDLVMDVIRDVTLRSFSTMEFGIASENLAVRVKGDLSLKDGANMLVTPTSGQNELHGVDITANNLNVDAGSSISVNGKHTGAPSKVLKHR